MKLAWIKIEIDPEDGEVEMTIHKHEPPLWSVYGGDNVKVVRIAYFEVEDE